MKIVERINSDKEIQALRKQLFDITGENLGFNYDCYLGPEEYKEHMKECIKAGRIIIRPKDEKVAHRFDSIFKK